MTFDPMSVEVTCVTLPKDHCVQVPWRYINVCGYSDQFCKLPHTYIHILRTYYVHTTYYVQNEWSHSLLLNSVQARQKLNLMYSQPAGHALFTARSLFFPLSKDREFFLHTSSEDFRNFPNEKADFKSFSQKTIEKKNAVSYAVIWFIIFSKHSHQILIISAV